MPPKNPAPRLALALATATALSFFTGCTALNTPVDLLPVTAHGLHGSVRGGQQPVSGAHVFLYAAGTTGYASPSRSLLNIPINPSVVAPQTLPPVTPLFVVTDARGNFSISGDYTCPTASDQVYLLVTGGNPGLGGIASNSGIAMMDALGTCGALSSSTTVVVNELSTVAAVAGLQQFMLNATNIGTSATNHRGLASAFATVASMVPANGILANGTTAAGNGTVSQAKLHALANVLASCVNTSSSQSPECQSLFSAATPTGGVAPTDTLAATLLIARNPASQVATLFNLAAAQSPFQPTLSVAPSDWIMSITYHLPGVAAPTFLAIDAAQNVWGIDRTSLKTGDVNPENIFELSNLGAVLSGPTGYTAGPIHFPEGLAIDDTGFVWIANTSNLLRYSSSGVLQPGFPASSGIDPQNVALDLTGRAWTSNFGGTDLGIVSSDGTFINTVTSPGFKNGYGLAIDPAGNVYSAGNGSNSILAVDQHATVLSGPGSGYFDEDLSAPQNLALDASGNIWVANTGNNAVISRFDSMGTPSGSFFTQVKGSGNSIAIDGDGGAWEAICGPGCITPADPSNIAHLPANQAGNAAFLSPATGFLNDDLLRPQGIAIDSSGNLWIANSAGTNATPGNVLQLVGVAAPVLTPTHSAVLHNKLGQRP